MNTHARCFWSDFDGLTDFVALPAITDHPIYSGSSAIMLDDDEVLNWLNKTTSETISKLLKEVDRKN